MPEVRLLADGAGRYEVKKGELFVCTNEEFARWAPDGTVELADKAKASSTASVETTPEVTMSGAARLVGVPPIDEPPAPAPKRRSRSTKPKG